MTIVLVTPKGNKNAGYFEICPTNLLDKSPDPPTSDLLRVPLDKCPDKKAQISFTIALKRLKQLSEEEFRQEKANNPDRSMLEADASVITSLNMTMPDQSRIKQ